jgi:hypothetical protein
MHTSPTVNCENKNLNYFISITMHRFVFYILIHILGEFYANLEYGVFFQSFFSLENVNLSLTSNVCL